MRVLVTGSAGMIGRALTPVLEARGHEVLGYDLVDGLDVLYVHTLEDAMRWCEVVVHLAGISYPDPGIGWEGYVGINVMGTMNVARVVEQMGVRRMVYSSSTSYYGAERGLCEPRFPVDEKALPAIAWLGSRTMTGDEAACLFYSTAKVMAERGLAAWGLRGVLEVAVLRLCPVSEQGAPYAWGLRARTDRVVGAIVRVVEDERPMGYEVFNIAEPDVDVVDTRKWEEWCDGG